MARLARWTHCACSWLMQHDLLAHACSRCHVTQQVEGQISSDGVQDSHGSLRHDTIRCACAQRPGFIVFQGAVTTLMCKRHARKEFQYCKYSASFVQRFLERETNPQHPHVVRKHASIAKLTNRFDLHLRSAMAKVLRHLSCAGAPPGGNLFIRCPVQALPSAPWNVR
jgi:hypothetical protein